MSDRNQKKCLISWSGGFADIVFGFVFGGLFTVAGCWLFHSAMAFTGY